MQKQILKKGNSGITLIALVITIIVLLILAAVAVISLTGENGILNRAGSASNSTKRAQVIEKAQLEILEKRSDSNHNGANISDEELREILGHYFASVPSSLTLEETETQLTAKSEYGGSTVQLKEILSGATAAGGSGGGTGSAGISGLTDMSGKSITASSLTEAGQDFKIGNEQFRVINPDNNGKVVAMPWYNLKLDAETMRQATSSETPGTVAFAEDGDKYWATETDTIDMFVKKDDGVTYKNNVQSYIDAYTEALPTGVTARIARYSEVQDSEITLPEGATVTKDQIRNPGQSGDFWLGSAFWYGANYVRRVYSTRRPRQLHLRQLWQHKWRSPCNRVL